MHPDAQRWDARYATESQHYLKRQVPPLLTANLDRLPREGLALDVAAGTSPAGPYLTQLGLHVIALDISYIGLHLARSRTKEWGRRLACAVIDLSDPWLPDLHFDVILDFYFLSRPLLNRFYSALKPGGLLFLETFLRTPACEEHSAYYLDPGELQHYSADWDVLYLTETWKYAGDDAYKPRRITQLIAQKPLESEAP
jgi:tellurite methyltransferase